MVAHTPDVLKKLGAPDLPMAITRSNLAKVMSDKADHGLTIEELKSLPQSLYEPIMVFQSASVADAFVVLTHLRRGNKAIMIAIHPDKNVQRLQINEISSAYMRPANWYVNQIEDGRLLYQDKKKSLAWARTYGLQLPPVRRLPSRLDKGKLFTDADIVKPIASTDSPTPLASIGGKRSFWDIFRLPDRETVDLANAPEISGYFRKKDLTLLQHFFALPHWIAKIAPGFAKIYERQLKRRDERNARIAQSLAEVPSMFGKDKLDKRDMQTLGKILWQIEGKPLGFENNANAVQKYVADGKFANGRTKLAPNPDFYVEYRKEIDRMQVPETVDKALLEIRKSLDLDLCNAYNRMAEMREVDDDTITMYRDTIGRIKNYFPHHRYGQYYIQAIGPDGKVVYREHFDALTERQARKKAKEIAAREAAKYPDAEWKQGKNDKLPDDILGAPIDPEAMEQIIRTACEKIPDKEQAKKIHDLLCQNTADVLKSRGWAEHSIGRKGVPGFEIEDIERILYDYKSGLYGWLTKMDAAHDFSKALGDINAKKQPDLWVYASNYIRDMLRNSDRIDRLTGNIKAVAFAWYLGANIKTAAVNSTQNIIVGVPRLQMDVQGGGRLKSARTAGMAD